MPLKRSGRKTRGLRGFIKEIPFLSCLSEDELTELEHAVIEKRFLKGEIILLEEDTSNYLYLVYSGAVKAVKVEADGKEHVLAIHKKGDFFGEMAILDGKTSPAAVVAMENADVGLIRRIDFERLLLTNNKVLREIIAVLCTRLRDSWLKIKVLSFASAEQRVRAVLRIIATQYGVKEQRGTIILLKLTHKDIGQYASLSRETVTRQLDKFQRAGEVEILEDRHILLRHIFFEKTHSL